MTKLEQVARVIHATQFARVHDEALGLTDLDVAHAAVKMLRIAENPTDFEYLVLGTAATLRDDWNAAIDAILNEKPE